jgi:hypothetical protein
LKNNYTDIKVERDVLLQARGAGLESTTTPNSNTDASKMSHPQVGILQSYERDRGVLETYWNRQKQFAELSVRDAAAELAGVEVENTAITSQIRSPQDLPSEVEDDADAFEPDDVGDASDPAAKDSQSRLLDTLAQLLPATGSYSTFSIERSLNVLTLRAGIGPKSTGQEAGTQAAVLR